MDLSSTRQKFTESENTRLSLERKHEDFSQRMRTALVEQRQESAQKYLDVERQRDAIAFQLQGEIEWMSRMIVFWKKE